MSSYQLNDLLMLVVTEHADGLSLRSGDVPLVYLDGEPHPVEGPRITVEKAEMFLHGLASTRQIRRLRQHGTCQFIYTLHQGTRFRVQARMQPGKLQLDLRIIATR